MCAMEEAMIFLPEEIIEKIFLFLPVKSLVRFTSVSKRFRSFILYDSQFTKSQLHITRDRKTLSNRFLVHFNGPRFKTLDVESSSFGDPPSSVRDINVPLVPTGDLWLLLGSCNGIVFLAYNNRDFYMWNPTVNFFKKLPQPPDYSIHCYILLCGVGYSPATDDYRVFVALTREDAAIFYSSKANAWTKLTFDNKSSPPGCCRKRGTLLKDALHWPHCGLSSEIVAFDLTQQEGGDPKFRKLLLPESIVTVDVYYRYICHRCNVSIGVVGGCLSCLVWDVRSDECVRIWVMNEYDVRESWSEVCNFKCSEYPRRGPWVGYARFMLMESRGAVVAGFIELDDKYHSLLVKILLDDDGKTSSSCKIRGCVFTDMLEYQETLITIDPSRHV